MLRLFPVLALALFSMPAAAHTGDHSHIGMFEGVGHGLLEHGALAALILAALVAGAVVIKRLR